MELFTEGLRASVQPPNLTLLIPGLAVLLAAQRTVQWALLGYTGAVGLVIFMRAVGWIESEADAQLLALAVLAGAVMIWWQAKQGSGFLSAAGAAAVGTVAALVWRPDAGPEFENLIVRGQNETWELFIPTAFYVAGLLLILIAIDIIPIVTATMGEGKRQDAIAIAGVSALTVIAIVLALDQGDNIASELLQMSV